MRYSHRRSVTFTLILLAALATAGLSEQKDTDHGIFSADSVQFQAGPPSLDSGAKFAVLEGDPNREGLFTMRLWLPDGFQIKPHWHPAVEHITVVSGTLHLGRGDAFDAAKTKPMPSGSFAFMAPKMNHFAWAGGDTVIQLHGVGPWQINYLDPADDPRKKR